MGIRRGTRRGIGLDVDRGGRGDRGDGRGEDPRGDTVGGSAQARPAVVALPDAVDRAVRRHSRDARGPVRPPGRRRARDRPTEPLTSCARACRPGAGCRQRLW